MDSPRHVAALADEIEEMWNGAKAGDVSRPVAVTAIGMAVVKSLPTILAALRTAGTGLSEAEAMPGMPFRSISPEETQARAEALADAQRRERKAELAAIRAIPIQTDGGERG